MTLLIDFPSTDIPQPYPVTYAIERVLQPGNQLDPLSRFHSISVCAHRAPGDIYTPPVLHYTLHTLLALKWSRDHAHFRQ